MENLILFKKDLIENLPLIVSGLGNTLQLALVITNHGVIGWYRHFIFYD